MTGRVTLLNVQEKEMLRVGKYKYMGIWVND